VLDMTHRHTGLGGDLADRGGRQSLTTGDAPQRFGKLPSSQLMIDVLRHASSFTIQRIAKALGTRYRTLYCDGGNEMTIMTARNGDIDIAYETLGPAGGVPLVLICGNATQMIHWPDEFCAALVDRGFHVVRFDNRDSGRSTHRADAAAYTLRDMADDAIAVLDAVGWASAHVVGISLGAMIGQVMAVHHPERARSLTSMSASPAWSIRVSRPRLRTLLAVARVARRAGGGREAAAETWVQLSRLIGSPGYPLDEQRAREIAVRAYDIAHDPAGDRRQLAAIKASGDRRAELGRVRVPTLVIHGEEDPLQSVRAGRATADAIPGARLVTFPGVGHDLAPEPLWPQLLDEIAAITAEADSPNHVQPPH
jgi:pimeloyl-ACP methyl ester carboxylesterase